MPVGGDGMNLKEIKALSDVKLLSSFYWIGVRTTKEVNSKRGLTNQTSKEEQWLIEVVANRFGVTAEALREEMNK